MNDLKNRFAYHPANTPERQELHSLIRNELLEMAVWMEETLPAGREKSIVLTKLEEAMFWANAAVARQNEEIVW